MYDSIDELFNITSNMSEYAIDEAIKEEEDTYHFSIYVKKLQKAYKTEYNIKQLLYILKVAKMNYHSDIVRYFWDKVNGDSKLLNIYLQKFNKAIIRHRKYFKQRLSSDKKGLFNKQYHDIEFNIIIPKSNFTMKNIFKQLDKEAGLRVK